jgi:hypothetical protein
MAEEKDELQNSGNSSEVKIHAKMESFQFTPAEFRQTIIPLILVF